jgi:glutathione S-transferase
LYAFAKDGVLPASTKEGLDALPNFSKWAAEVIKHPSVTYIWDEKAVVEGMKKRFAKMNAEGK